MATPSGISLPPVPSVGSVYDPSYWAFRRSDVTVFFTTDTFVLNSQTAFDTDGLMVYAENINIAEDISLPGKNLGLFARTITVPPSGITLDTSGTNGHDALPGNNETNVGEDGGDAGSIDMFIQDLFDEQFGRFTLKARGGNGGNGVQVVGQLESGGTGGAPGKAGDITIQYGSTAARLGVQIANAEDQSPAETFSTLKDSMDNNLADWTAMGVNVEAFKKLKVASSSFAGTVNAAVQTLNITLSYNKNPAEIITAAQKLQASLQQTLTTANPPYFDMTAINALVDMQSVVGQWNSKGYIYQKPADVKKTLTALKSIAVPAIPAGPPAALSGAIASMRSKMTATFARTRLNVLARCHAKGGKPGLSGAVNQASPAALAAQLAGSTPDGKLRAQALKFDQSNNDAAFRSAITLPEQAQMVLDQADGLYYEFTSSSKQQAMDLYTTLIERLSIVVNKNGNPNFEAAANDLVNEGITQNPIPELQRILGTAKTRVSHMLMNVDMFGHQAIWAPRLTYDYYYNLAKTRLDTLKDLEGAYNTLKGQLTDQAAANETIQTIASTVANGKAEASDRMSFYSSKTGPLVSSASTIAGFNPILIAKHAAAFALLPQIEDDIENKFNFDWGTALDAFASFCTVPSTLGGLATGISTLYKFDNSVMDASGNWVDKKNVVSQFDSAGSDLKTVVGQYTSNVDGTLSVDDASFAKLVGDQTSLEALLTQYKSGIDDSLSTKFKTALDDYVTAAQSRNQAVLDYNAAVQQYVQAKKDLESAKTLSQDAGQAALFRDPTLPSNFLWLQRRMNTEKLEIMRYLNYGARAVQYWAAASPSEVPHFKAGPLQDYTQLQANLEQLQNQFTAALDNYAGDTLETYPRTYKSKGMILEIPSDVINTLKDFQKGNKDQGTLDRYEMQYAVPRPSGDGDIDKVDDRALFASHCNVRLQQVRVWLPGATVDGNSKTASHIITVTIQHNGSETLYADSENGVAFAHDPIYYEFSYRSKGLKTQGDIKQWRVKSKQNPLSSQYSMDGDDPAPTAYAPVGPMTTFAITLLKSANPGLDLSKVKQGWMELHYWFNPCGTLVDVSQALGDDDD